jgi:Lipocalin-like domain
VKPVILPPGRARLAMSPPPTGSMDRGNNRNTGTPEENKAVVQGSLAHYGTFTVADKAITLKVEGSTWPAWAGTDQKRTIISFTGDEIKWSLPASIGGTAEVG